MEKEVIAMEQWISNIMTQKRVSRFAGLPDHRLSIALLTNEGNRVWTSGNTASDEGGVYEIGSLTKTMTGLLLAIGEQKGLWSRSDTLSDLIPEWSSSAFAAGTTLLQLVTHTAHLPRIPGNFRDTVTDKMNPYANYSDRHLAEAVLAEQAKPQTPKHLYSNYGFGLLGWALAQKLGMSLREALEQWIFSPLGMTDTQLRALDPSSPAGLVPVYDAKGKPVPHWSFHESTAGAGAVCSTAADMLQYVRANLGQAGESVSSAIEHGQKEHHAIFKSRGIGVGYAWMFYKEKDGSTTHWHNGGTYGSTSFLSFNREQGKGFVILSNYGTDVRSQIPLIGMNRMNVDKLARAFSNRLYQS
ncbi:serine hydrolase domain-containing protein [Paenibacillus soyae]|uniref:Beta-lactamase family protein n=1 Tax=Paenibacillus soyae TaxID=2969249 RepID=A0A9X2MQG0_9BACL|nr:serine hydrolase domain-containing protein [Paenibacillus soyae]MCR2806383.1 beta-lactamase family protein [Paenibacillus soyae]